VADEISRETAKGLWDGFYDLLLHVESISTLNLPRSSRSELEVLQTKLRVAADDAKTILERHSEALGIPRRNLPWSI
jgi:hypothetical protein